MGGKVASLQDEETGHSSDKRIKGQVTFQDMRMNHEWTGLSKKGTTVLDKTIERQVRAVDNKDRSHLWAGG